jgi:hypothetical protein
MAGNTVVEREIETHRRLISRLKREIFGVDKSHRSRYIREFNAEFRRFRRVTTAEAVFDRAARADIVYFGDYHPLDSSQDWALRLMRDLTARGRRIVLALEMLYVHQQEHLDRWMRGSMTEKEFLEAIDYRSEWGFNWASFRRFFELAKDPFVPVFGIDSEPREHLRSIRRRDRLAARRIATIRRFFPGHAILVVIGESHLASNHLPKAVRSAIGERFRETVIVQNIDDIYWELLRSGRENAGAVEIDDGRFCLVTTSPLLKYQAYRDIIDVWTDGEEGDRYTPFLHDAIRSILSFLDAGAMKRTVTIRSGWREPLAGALPEVRRRATYQAFSSHLRSRRLDPREIPLVRARLQADGAAYVAAENAVLVTSFRPPAAVREAARFVVHAMRDDVGGRPPAPLAPADAFYRAVIDEAFVRYAAETVNPAEEYRDAGPSAGAPAARAGGLAPGDARAPGERRTLERLLRYHARRERFAPVVPRMTRPLRRIYVLGFRTRLALERAIGSRLAAGMHRFAREGRLSTGEVLAFFRRRLEAPGEAVRLYFELAGRFFGNRKG